MSSGTELRDKIAKQLRRFATRSGLNMTEFQAQKYEVEMVDILAEMARDPTGFVPLALKRQCALDVVMLARGPMLNRPWIHDGKTIDPEAHGATGMTVGAEIDAIRVMSSMHQQLDELVRARVPVGEWPAEIREMAGEMVTYFETPGEAG